MTRPEWSPRNYRTPPRRARIVLWFTILLIVAAVVWAAHADIDQVVSAQGQVIASARSQVVQAADAGVLVELRVEEGRPVRQGEIVAVLEKERALAAYTESHGKVVALRMTVARLQAELAERELAYGPALAARHSELVATQMNLYRRRRQAHAEQIRMLQDNVRLAQQELDLNLPLEARGDISKAEILKLRRTLNEAQAALVNQRNKYLQDASAELNKAREDLNAQEQSAADRRQLLEHTDIVAPATGVVKSIRVTTLGGVVRQGDELLQILPTDSDLVVEARVRPADMAHLRAGLPVTVKLDAYDYAVFGALKGTLAYISPDALTEEARNGPTTYYRVRVSIGDAELRGKARPIDVRPGMTATVDIKAGERSVLSYLLRPVIRTFDEALGER